MSEAPDTRGSSISHCVVDEHGGCVTCRDEALPGRVISVDDALGLATVALTDRTAEVDITLVDAVGLDDVLLIHGGVAIEKLRVGTSDM